MNIMKNIILLLFALALLTTNNLMAGETSGSLTVNGQKSEMKYVIAYETGSISAPGFLDVVVVIADRQIPESVARDQEKLENMARNKELAALRVVINSDAKVMSAEPLHSAFTKLVSSALWIKWEPSAFDVQQIAGRFSTEKMQAEFGQKWQYDITFSAPIVLDPKAKTAPSK
jgi:hypothetical protein